jgi:hypothetical protein
VQIANALIYKQKGPLVCIVAKSSISESRLYGHLRRNTVSSHGRDSGPSLFGADFAMRVAEKNYLDIP